ncbi:Retrovirus-related Pol polyprotein from transposon 297 [Mytilus coruscus]|uniref:Retrovirus-related Pol polyprotein from transposon 297 n=1 Tax=Mytilus coruscus TaxID=42192 RepID=A0A6J8C3M6_MYTCO|nr:Retrovirus-related Pol polyprotein from transposon 297 [Mytilus coruscus]
MNMLTATGEKSPFHGKVKLNIQIGKYSYDYEFLLAEIKDNGILRMDFLTKNKCDLMLSKGYMMLYKERIPCFSNYGDKQNACCRISLNDNVVIPPESEMMVSGKVIDGIPMNLSGIVEPDKNFIEKNWDINSEDTGDAKPIKLRPYRIPLSKKLDAEEEIRKMAEIGIIEPSSSAWCAPIVIVTKKDGSIRFCCDFRKINHVTIKNCQPLPRIDDSLAALSGCRWLTIKGIATEKEKIKAVKDWPIPKNVKQVRIFVGLCSYYRRFVHTFASIAKPLHKLTELNTKFIWDEICQMSFDTLKQTLICSPILAFPREEGLFIIDADASQYGMGSVLSQVQDRVEKVNSYFSKTFSKPERHYCVTRKELFAMVSSTKNFHHYLYGRHFLVRIDHGALRWLMNFKNPEGQMARWLGVLGTYDFEIQHRAGRIHSNADALSRRPCLVTSCTYCTRIETKSKSEDLKNTTKDHAVRVLKKESVSNTKESLEEKGASIKAEIELHDLSFDNGVKQQIIAKEHELSSVKERKDVDIIFSREMENKKKKKKLQVVSLEKPIYQEHDDPIIKNGLATHTYPVENVVRSKNTTGISKIKHKVNNDIPVNVITRNMAKNRTDELPVELIGEIAPEKLIQSQKEDSDIKFIIDYKNIDVKPG